MTALGPASIEVPVSTATWRTTGEAFKEVDVYLDLPVVSTKYQDPPRGVQ